MALNWDTTDLIGFPCEGVLYGINIVLTCMASSQFITKGRNRNQADNLLWVLMTLLFCFCSAQYIIQWVNYMPYLNQKAVQDISANDTLLAIGDFFLTMANVTGNLVLIYRCHLIWEKNYWITMLPILPTLGNFITEIIMLRTVVLSGLGQQIPSENIVKLGTALLTLPLCTNILVTCFILGRLLYLMRRTASKVSPGIRPTCSTVYVGQITNIFIESGMPTLIGQLAFVVLFAMQSPAYQIVGYMVVQIYGIAPTLILYRVGKSVSMEYTHFRGLPIFRDRHKQQQAMTRTIAGTTYTRCDFEEPDF